MPPIYVSSHPGNEMTFFSFKWYMHTVLSTMSTLENLYGKCPTFWRHYYLNF